MNAFRMFVFAGLLIGLFFMSGTATPRAVGQQLTPPAAANPQPDKAPAGIGAGNNFFGQSPYTIMGTMPNHGLSLQIARQYAKATKEDDKKEIRKKLAETLSKEFDQLAQQQQNELDALEKQVASLKAILKKRKETKDAIVDRRLEQLIQDAEGLGWGSPGPRVLEYAPQVK
jgi:hypothetical protein